MSMVIRAALLAGLGIVTLTLPAAAASAPSTASPLMQVAQVADMQGADVSSRDMKRSKMMKRQRMMKRSRMNRSRMVVAPRDRGKMRTGFGSRPGNP